MNQRGAQAGGARAAAEGFEPVDHTADVGLRVWARDREGLFRQAALGLAWLLCGGAQVASTERIVLEAGGLDLEELLIAWLNEILFRAESGRLFFAGFEEFEFETHTEGYHLRAVAVGETRDDEHPILGVGVKAATYHDLSIAPDAEGGYDITIIFDT